MVTEIAAAVQARARNGPGPGRTRRLLTTVLLPVPGEDGIIPADQPERRPPG